MTLLIKAAAATTLTLSMCCAFADDVQPSHETATPSKHQLMKECMAKEKAGDVQMTPEQREQMKKTCREVSKTEEENVQTEKAAERAPDSGT